MGETLVLSPEELYYLGWLLKAEYIDYAYIAAMEDLGGSFRTFARDAAANLGARGILQEDFCGDFEPDPGALRLLRPIFFGGREMTVDICRLTGGKTVTSYKFHFHEDQAVMVSFREGKLMIAPTDRQGIIGTIDRLLPGGQREEARELSPEDAACIYVLKRVALDGSAERAAFAEDTAGTLYREAGNDRMEAAGREDILSAAAKMLEGA